MKHNGITQRVINFFDSVEFEISRKKISKDLDEQREALRKAPRVARSRNWDLM